MTKICNTCGLPEDICACATIRTGQQRVIIRLELRKWSKPTTIIEGIDAKSVSLRELASVMKNHCACGGTAKDNVIVLQGDHRNKVKAILVQRGFPEQNIETH